MRKHLTLLAAASLSAGALVFCGYDSTLLAQMQGTAGASNQQNASGMTSSGMTQSGRVAMPQEVSPSGQTDTQGIQSTLATATDTAIRNIDQLPNFFTPPDRQRLSDFSQQPHPQLATALGNFRAAWRQKYQQDFDLSSNPQVVFADPNSNLVIVQIQVTSPTLMSNQPVQSSEQQGQQYQPRSQAPQSPSDQQSSRGHTSWSKQLQSGTDQEGPTHAGVGGPGDPPAYVIPRPQPPQGQQTASNQGTWARQLQSSADQGGPKHAGVGGPGEPAANVIPPQQPAQGQQTAQGRQPGQGYQAVQAGQPQGPAGVSAPVSGLDVAIITFPPGYGLPSTNVALINEGSAGTAGAIQAAGTAPPTTWRLDVPDNLSSSDLATHLANHIEGLNADQNSWPNDVNEAYRLVTHHVMQAIYETPTQPGQTGM